VGAEPQPADRTKIGPYQVVRRLGEGGMGEVYLCMTAGGRRVAVKVIHRHLARDPQYRERFKREVAAAQRVNGLYTAHVVNADTDGIDPWLATAYIDAPSLKDKVSRGGPLSHSGVRDLAAALAEGLGEIHAVGLVHRDLKPSNVLVSSDGARIIDFGIAWTAEAATLTPMDRIVGTPSYMSPEQAMGGEIGFASDVFSLGGVIHYAATGEDLWGTGAGAAVLHRVAYERPQLKSLPPGIDSIVA